MLPARPLLHPHRLLHHKVFLNNKRLTSTPLQTKFNQPIMVGLNINQPSRYCSHKFVRML
jgi:hypothetical protein